MPLRQKVLRPFLQTEQCRFPSDEHPKVTHFGAFENDAVVGIVSVAPAPYAPLANLDTWQLRLMATETHVRHQGIGAKLVKATIRHVRIQGGQCLWCNVRVSAQGFYLKQGFNIDSEPFNIELIGPHVKMINIFT